MGKTTSAAEELLVIEVLAAHNLMPKDGQGSSSPFVEVEFEHQKRRTRTCHKDLNPVWNEPLIFPLSHPDDLPYRSIDIAVYNDHHSSAAGRNFLGRLRLPAAGIPSPGEDALPQLFPLEKRSLFSHIRGDLTLKIYRSTNSAANNQQHLATANQQKHAPDKPQSKVSAPPPPQQQQKPANQQAPPPIPAPTAAPPVVLAAAPLGPYLPAVAGQGGGGGGGQDFALKETRPHLGGGADKTSSTYDLVEQMQYLYVRVLRGRDFLLSGGGETLAEIKLGNYRGVTRPSATAQWDQVFAFSKETIQSSAVEIVVRERDREDPVGRLAFDLAEVPRRVPPDSSLAPQWCRMEDKMGNKMKAEVMVSVWFGTQADEAFAEAWHSKAAGVHGDGLGSIKSKVYVAPKLWYLRVSIIEAQDLVPGGGGQFPNVLAKAQVGNQVSATRPAAIAAGRGLGSPFWDEDLMFVVAEPFDDVLVISVEDRIAPGRDEVLGRVVLPMSAVERRLSDRPVVSRWFGLDRGGAATGRFAGSRVHLRLSLDGAYHVLDESTAYISDPRPTERQLWGPHVGVLEMGILGAAGLMPMKARGDGKGGTTDAYCVAKYGSKWIRTRTVVDSFFPRWNEQYTWEVTDPCTVITVGVFDNSHVGGGGTGCDARIGKVRIRLSTLQTDRVYTHTYPLLLLHPSGVKKMGDLHLAVRFSCINVGNMLHAYLRPLLPKMHYVAPLLVRQVEGLRYQATNVVAARLGRAEPPLGREVVEYMLDHGSHLWSMRRSKANFFRLVGVLSAPIAVGRWIESVRSWQRPVHSVIFTAIFVIFAVLPELILPTAFLMMAIVGLWRYRLRPRHPPHMDMRLSHAEAVYGDELDEEFDTFPTSRSAEVVRMRYDRLRSVAGRVQTVVGDLATQAERMQGLLSWRDPRATFLFLLFCVAAAAVFFAVPLRLLVGAWGLYALRPPKFRSRLPSPAMSFFRRLPSNADSLL